MIETLTQLVNRGLETAYQARDSQGERVRAEVQRLKGEQQNLVRFLPEGGDSSGVREELCAIEQQLEGLRPTLMDFESPPAGAPPKVHPAWIRARLERLEKLLRQDLARAKTEIAKHLDGDLVISPLPSPVGGRASGSYRAGKPKQPSS